MRRVAVLTAMGLAFASREGGAEEPRGTYVHVLGSMALGRSLRFNNPYRLDRPLGSTAESVSLAAPYLDLGVAVTLGLPSGLQHGLSLRYDASLSGIPQVVITPSYLALYRLGPRLMPFGRIGTPLVMAPNRNLGGEIAVGAVVLLTGAIGLTAQLGGSAFYGAATREVSATFIPLGFAELGVAVDWEILP